MQISTTRFGTLEIKQSEILTFPEGILGFNKLRQFVLVDDPTDELFSWLQSCESPAIAFPVLDPQVVYKDFKLNLNRAEKEVIKAAAGDRLQLLLIVTIPDDVTMMTANLKAPVVLNLTSRYGKQVIAQENDYPIKYPIFSELQIRVSQQPTAFPIKPNIADFDGTVRLPSEGNAKSVPQADV